MVAENMPKYERLPRCTTFLLAGHVVRRGCPLGLRAGPGVSRGCGSGRLGGSLPLNWTKRLAIFLLFSPPTHACGGLCCFCRLCRLYCCRRRRHCRLCRCRLLPDALPRRSVEPEGPFFVSCCVVVLRPRVRRRRRVERLGLRPIGEKVARNRIWWLCGGLCVSCSLDRARD